MRSASLLSLPSGKRKPRIAADPGVPQHCLVQTAVEEDADGTRLDLCIFTVQRRERL